jgi:hypothetical protein
MARWKFKRFKPRKRASMRWLGVRRTAGFVLRQLGVRPEAGV